MNVPREIELFLSTAKDISLGYSEINFFKSQELLSGQIGYSITESGNSLITDAEGSWQSNWLVIATDHLGNPLLVDLSDIQMPVSSAMHGEGNWEPYLIADSLENFKQIIDLTEQLSTDRKFPVALEANPIPANKVEAALNMITELNPSSEISYWEHVLT